MAIKDSSLVGSGLGILSNMIGLGAAQEALGRQEPRSPAARIAAATITGLEQLVLPMTYAVDRLGAAGADISPRLSFLAGAADVGSLFLAFRRAQGGDLIGAAALRGPVNFLGALATLHLPRT
jgi:hypothetical protein